MVLFSSQMLLCRVGNIDSIMCFNFKQECPLGINIEESHILVLTKLFECKVEKHPIMFLGVPLGGISIPNHFGTQYSKRCPSVRWLEESSFFLSGRLTLVCKFVTLVMLLSLNS